MKPILSGALAATIIFVLTNASAAKKEEPAEPVKLPSLIEIERACVGSLDALETRGVVREPAEAPAMGAAAFACGCLVSNIEAKPEMQLVAHEMFHTVQMRAAEGEDPDAATQQKLADLGLVKRDAAGANTIVSGDACPVIAEKSGDRPAQ